MIGELLSGLLGQSHDLLLLNMEGISDEEGLIKPQPGGNSLNWIAGHILVTRNSLLTLLEESPVLDEERSAPYIRGSTGDIPGNAFTLDEIRSLLELTRRPLAEGLTRLSRDELMSCPFEDKPGVTLANRLALFSFHETYHVGQTGLLRRLLDKPGTIT